MNDFVVADPKKCIGCRTCEVACAMAHAGENALDHLTTDTFSPRLQVVKTAKVSMPVQCRHCEDAPCARACTVRAIVQSGNSVQVVEGRCVGCKACLIACPYGAIELIVSDTDETNTRVEALKCDLCVKNDSGPACIKVCPTKALHRVEGAQIAGRLRNKRLKAALGAINTIGSN
ncbi:4Fe-4S dicluster domain-containing protein [Anaerospora sp.]|jgi:electron transport protein HydN|uniref:4Fe-4S dicluster domain-containing protein n=1 Tax=Anaerospora sp. TaxID=1960278 RepID=UPI00289C8D87|nr:4Fe-4S dicluster domain-containing protein [Anaerospora sp.]MDF2930077.1 4Fe-4S ferredoxin, iron-sulpur binding protein [Anaerospora sp.]